MAEYHPLIMLGKKEGMKFTKSFETMGRTQVRIIETQLVKEINLPICSSSLRCKFHASGPNIFFNYLTETKISDFCHPKLIKQNISRLQIIMDDLL